MCKLMTRTVNDIRQLKGRFFCTKTLQRSKRTHPIQQKNLISIRTVYDRKTLADCLERIYRHVYEQIFGIDYSIFEKTILYYKEVKGQNISHKQAFSKALNKKVHKAAWFVRKRDTIEDMMHFYKEVDVYLFRQPYLMRRGGYRWYIRLINHIKNPSILEYGCGSAVLTEWLMEKFPTYDYTVADIPSATLEFVKWKKAKFNYDYTILTIGQGKEGIPLSKKYDLIICENVLEHTPSPLDIVCSFVDHLSFGGVLVVDFLNSPGGENIELAVMQRERVKKYLKENLIALKAIDEPKGNNGIYVREVIWKMNS